MNSKYDYAECLRSGWATPSEIHGAADLIDQLHDQLALAEKQRDAAVEALIRTEHDLRRYDPECDESYSGIRPRANLMRNRVNATLARIRELGEKGGE